MLYRIDGFGPVLVLHGGFSFSFYAGCSSSYLFVFPLCVMGWGGVAWWGQTMVSTQTWCSTTEPAGPRNKLYRAAKLSVNHLFPPHRVFLTCLFFVSLSSRHSPQQIDSERPSHVLLCYPHGLLPMLPLRTMVSHSCCCTWRLCTRRLFLIYLFDSFNPVCSSW